MTTRSGPLRGVRVVELGNFIAGPFAGQLLGDLGAEIVKIEPPDGGDTMREWGVRVDGEGLWWSSIARNKASVVADLRTSGDREFVRRIIADADVLLENFRPGRLAEWDLDDATLRVLNPRLIVVHVSGFGQTGPRAAEAGFGSIGEAVGGIRHTTGDADRPAARCGISLGDSLAALFAVVGALGALHERATSGVGQEVDVAIYEAVAALMESTIADYEVAGIVRSRSGGRLPGVAPANAYPTADGSEILIAANADAVFRRLCTLMGDDALAADERFATHGARGEHADELDELISSWTARHSSAELLAAAAEAGVPAGRVYTAPDILADAHYAARGMVDRLVTRHGRDIPTPGVVPKFSRTPGAIASPGPALGAHTEEYQRRYPPRTT